MQDVSDRARTRPADRARSAASLRALALGNAVSLSGNVVMTVAIPWLVLTMTGSAALTGLVVVAGASGAVVGGLAAGRVVDALGPVRASAAADLLSGLAVVPLPVLLAWDVLALWHVVVLAAMGTLVDSAGSTARQGLVPVVADRDGVPRERANALFTSAEHVGYLLGAPVAGLLIAGLGVAGAMGVAVALFGVAALVVVRFIRPTGDSAPAAAVDPAGLREVLAFVWSDPALRALVVFPTLAVTLVGPIVPIVLPVLAREAFGDPVVLGAMVAAYGAGGLIGTSGYGAFGAHVSRRSLYRAVFVVWPGTFVVIAVARSLPVTMAMLVILGAAAGALVPLQATIRQERSPERLLPRIVGLSTATIPVAAPIGVLVTGVLIDALQLDRTLLVLAAAASVLGAWVVASRTTHAFDPGISRPSRTRPV